MESPGVPSGHMDGAALGPSEYSFDFQNFHTTPLHIGTNGKLMPCGTKLSVWKISLASGWAFLHKYLATESCTSKSNINCFICV